MFCVRRGLIWLEWQSRKVLPFVFCQLNGADRCAKKYNEKNKERNQRYHLSPIFENDAAEHDETLVRVNRSLTSSDGHDCFTIGIRV